jgi:hypothetical protein
MCNALHITVALQGVRSAQHQPHSQLRIQFLNAHCTAHPVATYLHLPTAALRHRALQDAPLLLGPHVTVQAPAVESVTLRMLLFASQLQRQLSRISPTGQEAEAAAGLGVLVKTSVPVMMDVVPVVPAQGTKARTDVVSGY